MVIPKNWSAGAVRITEADPVTEKTVKITINCHGEVALNRVISFCMHESQARNRF